MLLAGHSLGSVVIYDALNALLLRDAELKGADNVRERTKLLLTFGSPLDKTAYFFRQQGRAEVAVREALAASLQPLILNYEYRTFPWINVHSSRDPIGNGLKFYDLPAARRRRGSASRTSKTLTRCCRSRPTPSIGTTPPSPTPSSTRSRG